MGFKFRYTQSVSDGQSTPVTENYTIDTTDSVWDISPLNSPWANSGCYAGATPANGSEIGSYSIANWSGWNKDTVYSDMRDLNIRSYSGSSQQNLRFIAKYNSGSFTVNRQSFNWTNLREPTVEAVTEGINELTNYTEYDPYRRDNKSISAFGNSNSPLNIAPLESLQINNLIFVPIFLIKEVEYYDYDDVAGGYASALTPSATTLYTWADIKPQDKTPAGEHYDADLFERGWTEITPTQEGGRRFRFCCGVALTPYYGNCSNSYNPTTDTYTSGTNPDDGKVYGDRQVFGSVVSQADEYPIIGNTTNMSRPCLMVMTESYDSVTGGLTYTLPAGVSFTNILSSGTVSGNVHAFASSWSLTSDYHRFAATTQWTTEFFSGNQMTTYFYADVDPSTSNTSPDLSIPSVVVDTDVNISSLYNITELPTANRMYLPNNNPVAFYFAKNNRNVTATNVAFYSINALWHTIASLGCYVADSTTTAQKAPTGYYVGENNHLYLGYMDGSGITNGTMLQGKDIQDSTQARIDDIIQDTPYTPVIPTPGGGGGGDDPSNPPSPSGKSEGKLTGAETTGHKTREFGSGSVTYYGLNISQVEDFKAALWAQPADFYDAIQIAGRQNTSIFDYIASFRYYPSNMNVMGISIGAAQPVYLGTGAKFSKSDGTDFQLNPMTGFFGQIEWCRWNLSDFTGWRENFLDYAPYLKMSIYLPYAGTFDLDPQVVASINPIQQATIYARACVDLNTGSLTYFIDADGVLILEKTVKFGVDLPLTGNDSVQQSTAIIRSTNSLVSTVLGGAAAVGTSIASGNIVNAAGAAVNTATSLVNSSVDAALANRQVPVQVGGFGGTMSNITQGQDPYITIYRQKIANPKNYGHTVGYLTQSTHKISELTGFTKCTNPDLSGISATDEEKAEIASILTDGFYA